MSSLARVTTPSIAAELRSRQRARVDLMAFTERTFPRYRPAPHHRLIAEKLEAVERGEIDRLMLLVPPRHGKSELASIRFPAWAIGRRPERQLINVSATAALAEDFGRSVRNCVQSPEFEQLFERTELAEDSAAKGKWHTKAGGIYYSVGVEGGVLGRGGDMIMIDDPYASMEEALSETVRDNVWSWYLGTLYNRLMPGGAIILINHRMHEDDLSGRLLAQQAAGGDKWDVVELPAIVNGQALWPTDYPIEALQRIKRNTLPRFWSALYMQNPTPDEGTFFKRDWIRTYVAAPPRNQLKIFGASDYAMTANGGDFTVHAVVGVDQDDNLWLLDLWRRQADPREWVEVFCDMVIEWKPQAWAEENVQITSGIGPYLESRQRVRKAWVAREQFPTRGDKAFRAQSIRGRMALGGLYVPANAPWLADFIAELIAFDAGKHDDIVDALGLLGQLLDVMLPPKPPEPPPKKPAKLDWFEVRDDQHENNWRVL